MQQAFDKRVDEAKAWLLSCRTQEGGWGWVPDVDPNPQNTAECIASLIRAGTPAEQFTDVVGYIDSAMVARRDGRVWKMDTAVDQATRLEALLALRSGGLANEAGVADAIEHVIKDLESALGDRDGWSFDTANTFSPFASALALVALARSGINIEQYHRVWTQLLAFLNQPRFEHLDAPLAHRATVAASLSDPVFTLWHDSAFRKTIKRTAGALLSALSAPVQGESESFMRASVRDTWRHSTLQIIITSLAIIQPSAILQPQYRNALCQLLALQCIEEDSPDRGAFQAGDNGYPTTYATAQGIQALTVVQNAVAEVSPADLLGELCRITGLHHSDSREVARIGSRSAIVNSYAAAAYTFIVSVLVAVATIFVIESGIGKPAQKLLLTFLVWSAAGVWYSWFAARWPKVQRRRILLGTYGIVTAVLFPLIAFVFA
jgi:hypothetical protein